MRQSRYVARYMAWLSLAMMLMLAGSALADKKADLQEQFKKRFPEMEKLRESGKIGETFDGWAEAVQGKLDDTSAKLVSDENVDRKELYQIIADEEKTTPELVAKHAAQRRYKLAKAGYWFKHPNGEWKKK